MLNDLGYQVVVHWERGEHVLAYAYWLFLQRHENCDDNQRGVLKEVAELYQFDEGGVSAEIKTSAETLYKTLTLETITDTLLQNAHRWAQQLDKTS